MDLLNQALLTQPLSNPSPLWSPPASQSHSVSSWLSTSLSQWVPRSVSRSRKKDSLTSPSPVWRLMVFTLDPGNNTWRLFVWLNLSLTLLVTMMPTPFLQKQKQETMLSALLTSQKARNARPPWTPVFMEVETPWSSSYPISQPSLPTCSLLVPTTLMLPSFLPMAPRWPASSPGLSLLPNFPHVFL